MGFIAYKMTVTLFIFNGEIIINNKWVKNFNAEFLLWNYVRVWDFEWKEFKKGPAIL